MGNNPVRWSTPPRADPAVFQVGLTKQAKRRRRPDARASRGRASRGATFGPETLERRTFLAATPLGNEFLVNQMTASNQSTPDVAVADDGRFIVAWHSPSEGIDINVLARRYDAQGQPLGNEFVVNTTVSGPQSTPSVAVDTDGDFAIAWMSGGQDGSGYGIYVRRYNADGTPAGGETPVNQTTAGNQRYPALAVDDDGDLVIAWSSNGQDGGDEGVYARRFDAAGTALGNEFQVNQVVTGAQRFPSVAIDADGDFAIAWTDLRSGEIDIDVYARRYARNGTPLGNEFRVNTTVADIQANADLAMDDAGNFTVAWNTFVFADSSGDVYARRYAADGNALGGEFLVNTTTIGRQYEPAVAMDRDGDLVVTWQSYESAGPSPSDVRAREFGNDGVPAGNDFAVNTFTAGEQLACVVATDAEGDFVIAWESVGQDGSGGGIYARQYVDGPPQVLALRGGGNGIDPLERLVSSVPSLVAEFSENLNTAGGAGGANSVTNVANWRLTRNGANVSSLITAIAFAANPTTGRFEATLNLSAPLTGGAFVLTAREAIRDLDGNGLDGDANSAAGGDFTRAFTIDPPAAAGPEFRANTFTAGAQGPGVFRGRSAAAAPDGRFLVTWDSQGQDGSVLGVYAQGYGADGVPLGAEFRVNQSTTIGDQSGASVAADAAGNFVIVWQSHDPDGTASNIYARRFTADGTPLGAEVAVNSVRENVQAFPSVASSGGGFVVAWLSGNGSGFDVRARRFDAAGAPQGGEIAVNTNPAVNHMFPAVAADADGDFVVAYQSYDNAAGGDFDVFARRFDAAGAPRGDSARVSTTTAGHQRHASAAADAAGNVVIAWESHGQDGSDSGVYARRYDAAGAPRGGEFAVNTSTAGDQAFPSVAADPDGDFVVAWTSYGQDGSDNGVYARRYDAAGSPQPDGEFRVNTFTDGGQAYPTVAADADGDFVVAWQSEGQDGSSAGVYAQRYASPLAGGALAIEGTSGDDTIVLSTDATGDLTYVVNGVSTRFDGPTPLAVAVNGLAGIDTLADSGDRNFTLTDAALTAPGMAARSLSGIERVELTGGNSANTLDASTYTLGSVVLRGLGGNDALRGGAGNDVLQGGPGTDTFAGGAGSDTADYSDRSAPVALRLDGLANDGQAGENENLPADVENLTGGSAGDTLVGNALDNVLDGGLGIDSLTGGPGRDTASYASHSAAVNLTLDGQADDGSAGQTENLQPGDIEDLTGGDGFDTLTGDGTANTLRGGPGNDTLQGLGGDDTLDGGTGADEMAGGTGVDAADYSSRTGTVSVTLNNTADDGDAALDFTEDGADNVGPDGDVENVLGGAGSDFLFGNASANTLAGNGGDDALQGRGGGDTLDGGAANDTLDGGGGADTLRGGDGQDDLKGGDYSAAEGDGNDLLDGGAGDDKLRGGAGADDFAGGPGVDEASYADLTSAVDGVVVDLDGVADDGRLNETDNVRPDIENLTGSAAQDELTGQRQFGNTVANAIAGGPGDDTIFGVDGDDVLLGGPGNDVIFGGYGNDVIGGGFGNDSLSGEKGDDLFTNRDAGDPTPGATDIDRMFGGPGFDFRQGDAADFDTNGNSLASGVERVYDPVVGDDGGANLSVGAGISAVGGRSARARRNAAVIAPPVVQKDARGVVTRVIITGTDGADDIRVTQRSALLTIRVGGGQEFKQTVATTTVLVINGLGGDDVITLNGEGTAQSAVRISSTLDGGMGNDVLTGGAGNDEFRSGSGIDGNDVISGGPDLTTTRATDKVDYSRRTRPLNISLDGLAIDGQASDGERDNVRPDIEVVFGGFGSDTITGSDRGEVLAGGAGGDTIQGNAGNDFLVGSAGSDFVIGAAGADLGNLADGEQDFYVPGLFFGPGIPIGKDDVGDRFQVDRDNLDVRGARPALRRLPAAAPRLPVLYAFAPRPPLADAARGLDDDDDR